MINKCQFIGNLGNDPVVTTLENGTKVATFSIATSENYKDKAGNKVEKTEWHNIVAWRGLAEVVEKYMKKGQQVFVEGKLTHRSYDSNDGQKKYISEIVANEIKMLGMKKSENSAPPPPPEEQAALSNDFTRSLDDDNPY